MNKVVVDKAPPARKKDGGRKARTKRSKEDEEKIETLTTQMRLVRENLRAAQKDGMMYREQAHALRKENRVLRDALAHDEADPQLMISFLNQELAARDATITSLADKLTTSAAAFEEELASVSHGYEARLLDAEAALDEAHYAYEVLEAEVLLLREFRDSKQFIIDELDELRAELDASRRTNIEAVALQESQLKAQLKKATQMYQARIEGLELNAKRSTLEVVDRETRQIVRDNRRLGNELALAFDVLDQESAAHAETKQNLHSLQQEYDALLRFLRKRGLPLPHPTTAVPPSTVPPTTASPASASATSGNPTPVTNTDSSMSLQDMLDHIVARSTTNPI